jgi:geranylgeranylglycerol-phosphate geranylgeranyltransferase
MMSRVFRVAASLTRLDTCALVFLSILLPVYYRTYDLEFSLTSSVPILPICMCGFVINDLSDIEKDKQNHPHRPLPSHLISPIGASVVYFTLLATSLILVKLYVDLSLAYLYLLLLLALINYNYIVCYVPAAKNIYVATVGLIPIFIMASLIQNTASAYWVAPSLFMFLFGREVLMDVQDLKGDGETLTKAIGVNSAENFAFLLKIAGCIWLCLLIKSLVDAVVFLILISMELIFLACWRRKLHRRAIIHAMKLQPLLGIEYLLS